MTIAARRGSREILQVLLNAGTRPVCSGLAEQSSDWVQFQFIQGRSRPLQGAADADPQRRSGRPGSPGPPGPGGDLLRAPYMFQVDRGQIMTSRADGFSIGVLADCPDLTAPGPCIKSRQLKRINGRLVIDVTAYIPPGGDPLGSSGRAG